MKSRLLFSFFVLAVSVGIPLCSVVLAQDLDVSHRVPKNPDPLPLHSSLRKAEVMARDSGRSHPALSDRLERHGVRLRGDGKVHLQINGPTGGAPVPLALVESVGGDVSGSWRSYLEAWIPAARLTELARSLPPGYVLEPTGELQGESDDFVGEGPGLTHSEDYHEWGAGAGIKIAIIDREWDGILDIIQSGDAAPLYETTFWNYTSDAFVFPLGKTHGTLCYDTLYDHAPDATYYLCKVDSSSDLGNVVEDCIAEGVGIISHSWSWVGSWHDNVGAACEAANAASDAGMLFFTSSGNYADRHYQGDLTDPDADDWHNFQGADETINITAPSGATVSFRLQWDPAGSPDLDLYLLDSDLQPLDVGDDGGTSESVSWENDTGSSQLVHVAVWHESGPAPELEIFGNDNGVWQQHIVAEGSTRSPSNATFPNVISVGAVQESNYELPPLTEGIHAVYSSQGPTNDDSLVPRLCGPTDTTSSWYEQFSGTSCSCPHAAGTAAALASAMPGANAFDVRLQLFQWAERNDWGEVGADSIYGWGGVFLPPWADCNANLIIDGLDIANDESEDDNHNRIPDECEGIGYGYQVFASGAPLDPWNSDLQIPVTIAITPPPETPPGTIGFRMSLGHDLNLLQVAEVGASSVLQALNGGTGPEFEELQILAEGFSYEVLYGFEDNEPIILEFATQTPAVNAVYDYVGVYGATDWATELTPLSLPGFPNDILLPGQASLPSQISSETLSIVPVPSFLFSLPDTTVTYDPQVGEGEMVVPMVIEETLSAGEPPTQTAGFRFVAGLSGDQEVMVPIDVELAPTLQALNGGTGPLIFIVDLSDEVVDVRVVYGLAFQTIPFDVPTECVAINYELDPLVTQGDTDGARTTIRFLDDDTYQTSVRVGFASRDVRHQNALVHLVPTDPAIPFRRGDFDAGGSLALNDGVGLLNHLFVPGSAEPLCADAADADDSGLVGLPDAIFLLNYLFGDGPPPPAPGPGSCGSDPTLDGLDCWFGGC